MGESNRFIPATLAACWLIAAADSLADNILLAGKAVDTSAGSELAFSLSGENRQDVIGGTIKLGDAEFTIDFLSAQNLVGATREADGKRHHALFSSSYSRVTYTGDPWFAAAEYRGCETPYNSYLAVYTLDKQAASQLPDPPFPALAQKAELAEQSVVYCFVSAPLDR